MKLAKILTGVFVTSSILAFPLRGQEDDEQGHRVDPDALKQLAERGGVDAQFELGIRLLSGEGLTKDEKQAADWLQKAAAQQHLPSMNALGTMAEEGVGLPKDLKKAFEWYEKSAKYGFALAQLNLADCYDQGKGVEKDEKQAISWLSRAANQNFAPAQAAYGWKLEHALGTEKKTQEAATWYLKAAQQGLVAAMTHLAYLYYTGVGVPLDYRRAEAWYRLAARSQDPWAHNDLAWFLVTCPDESVHDPDAAVEFARSAVKKLSDQRYEAIDTLAATLARSGKFGEAVQTEMKAIVRFSEDKSKLVTPEERVKLEKELTERLGLYKKQQPYSDKAPEAEAGTKPMIEDRILQEQELHRPNKKKPEKKAPEDRAAIS
ncbi:MAG: tetratricopeptide repeat protein [Verrucomicrobiaceae bacterium]